MVMLRRTCVEQMSWLLADAAGLLSPVGQGCPPGKVAQDGRQYLAGQAGVAIEANGGSWPVKAGQPGVVALATLRVA